MTDATNLIERLRSAPNAYAGYVMHEDGVIPADGRLMHEASDEIERVRAERDELRRQLAEAEQDAQRYRWLRGDSCPDHSVRWTQWEVRCWRAPQWTADLRRSALDVAIDAAMRAGNE